MYEEGLDPVTPIKKEAFTFPAVAEHDVLGIDPALEIVVDIQELLNVAVPALEAGDGPINLDKIFPPHDLDRVEKANYFSFGDTKLAYTPMTNADEVDSNSAGVDGWNTLTIKTEDLDLTSPTPCRQSQVVTVPYSERSYSSSSSRNSTPEPIVYSRRTPGRKPSAGGPVRPRKRQPTKDTAEYYEKRARNNVAVRKSRDKAKYKQNETETRVQALCDENEHLQKKVDLLSKELNVLKSLFINVGASLPTDFEEILNR